MASPPTSDRTASASDAPDTMLVNVIEPIRRGEQVSILDPAPVQGCAVTTFSRGVADITARGQHRRSPPSRLTSLATEAAHLKIGD